MKDEDMLVDELLAEGEAGAGGAGAAGAHEPQQTSGQRPSGEPPSHAMGALQVNAPPTIVLPGDNVTAHVSGPGAKLSLGTGLVKRGDDVFATRAGLLRQKAPRTWWVEGNQRRYIPKCEDHVLGIIEDRAGDYYKVNIFGPSFALLPQLAFDGATRRNKPDLKRGALVYCRVAVANKDMEPELSCEAAGHAIKKDWMTREGTFGELLGGTNARCSLMMARRLMQPDCPVLATLGKELAFEIAVGENGAFWVNSKGGAPSTTVIANAIRNAEHLLAAQHAIMARHTVATMRQKFGGGGGGR